MRNCIPCLGENRAKLYTLVRTERTKTVPCPVAYVWIGHIRESPSPQGLSVHYLRQKKFKKILDNNSLTTYTLAVTREGGLLV